MHPSWRRLSLPLVLIVAAMLGASSALAQEPARPARSNQIVVDADVVRDVRAHVKRSRLTGAEPA